MTAPLVRSYLELGPGDMIVVGPNGRLVIGVASDGDMVVEVTSCAFVAARAMAAMDPVFRAAVDEAWRNWDDLGERIDTGKAAP